MRYMLLVYSPESAWTEDEWIKCTEESKEVCFELHLKNQFISASPLHPVSTATTIRVRSGKPTITTGPFAETVEQLGGYFILDVPDLDQAISIAVRLPAAKKGTIEIRPLFPIEGLPAEQFATPANAIQWNGSTYMLLCYDDEQYWNKVGEKALHESMLDAVELTKEADARGQYICASPLQPVSMATSVRIRDGRKLVTDGPFAETREFLGGFYLLRLRDLNQAISIAARHPGARVGSVEVRQIYTLENMPVS